MEILLPALIFSFFGNLETGVIISIGALCVSISDAPGPLVHKRNGMLYCNICIFLVALLTGFLNLHLITLGLLILACAFFFTMFSVFGERAGAIGTASLLVLILRMSKVDPPIQVIYNSLLVLSGGTWYMLVALVFYRLRPYRPSQRALGNCIHEMARFLRIKSGLFEKDSDFEELYHQLVEQQVAVNTAQDAARELLFKNRVLLKESSTMGRRLVITFVNVVDLYEQMMANWYDFAELRAKYAETNTLDQVSNIMEKIAGELDDIAYDIQSNIFSHERYSPLHDLEQLKIKIESIRETGASSLSLKKVLVNLRKLYLKMNEIYSYFDSNPHKGKKMRTEVEYSKFVAHQRIAPSVFINNLSMDSAVFRHALRMTITCGLGFIVSRMISYGHHSYWVLLTIAFILKPGYSLTKTRNFDRLIGTLAGGIIGLLAIAFIPDRNLLFAFLVFLMIGTYTFQRQRYIVMVIFMTPYILILLHFLGLGILDVAGERLLDTGIGSVLAFLASYFLFPYWEAKHLPGYMLEVLRANLKYLLKLTEKICGNKPDSLDYKLVRKNVFVTTANMAAAFHRMQSEPKDKQVHAAEIHEFVVLNHLLSSNIAAASAVTGQKELPCTNENSHSLKRAIEILDNIILTIDPQHVRSPVPLSGTERNPLPNIDVPVTDQLRFIQKVTSDIKKVTSKISGLQAENH